jgi:uncharacterized cupredoxin-like copper-binding protein
VRQRTFGVVLIVLGLAGLIGTAWAFAARSDSYGSRRWMTYGPVAGLRVGPTCDPPTLPGQTVDVVLSDMGGMIGGSRTMSVAASPSLIPAGEVSLRLWNAGMMVHELVVLPLPPGGAGTRVIGSDGRVSEGGSLGEASRTCGEGAGDGIAPGAAAWVTLHLDPGSYELICNLPGHYAMGMFAELGVG